MIFIIAAVVAFILLLIFALCKVAARAEKFDKPIYCKDCEHWERKGPQYVWHCKRQDCNTGEYYNCPYAKRRRL